MWNNFNNHPNRGGGNRPRRPSCGFRARGNRGRGVPHHWNNHNSHQQYPPLREQQFCPQQLQQPHFGSGNAPQFSAFSDDAFQQRPFLQGVHFDRPVPSAYRHHSGRSRDRDFNPPHHINRPKRFLSPPRAPIVPQRPPSPLPGSEEYRQRNIQHTSELIKRQLLVDDSLAEPTLNVSLDGMVEGGVPSVFQRDHVGQQQQQQRAQGSAEKKKGKSKPRPNRFEPVSTPNRPIDVHEIHQQIVRHISNLSYNKKLNIVNQVGNTAGYDVAILQIQKQKRLELSRALRDLCSSNIAIDPGSDVLNDIIPDIGIKLEDLPREVIEELSSLNAEHQWANIAEELDLKQDPADAASQQQPQQFLSDLATASPPLEDVHMGGSSSCYIDSSIVDPELCFKQAEQLISGFDEETNEFLSTSPYDATGVLYDNGLIGEFPQTADDAFNETPLFCEQVPEIHEGDAIDSFVEQIPELHTCGYDALPDSELFSDQISDIRNDLPCSNTTCDFSQPPEQLNVSELPCNELTSVRESTVKLFENYTIPEFEEEVPSIIPLSDIPDKSVTDQSATVSKDLSDIQLPNESLLPLTLPTEAAPNPTEEACVEPSSGIETKLNLFKSINLNQPNKTFDSPKAKISIVLEKSPKLPPSIFQEETTRKLSKNSVKNSEIIFKKLCDQSSRSKNSTPSDLYCGLPPLNKPSGTNNIEPKSVQSANFGEIPLPINESKDTLINVKEFIAESSIELKQDFSATTEEVIEESNLLNADKSSLTEAANIRTRKEEEEFDNPTKSQKSGSNSGKSSSPLKDILKHESNNEGSVSELPKGRKCGPNRDAASPSIKVLRVKSDLIVEKSHESLEPSTHHKSLSSYNESPTVPEKVHAESNSENAKPLAEIFRLKRNRKIEPVVVLVDPINNDVSDKISRLNEEDRKNETSVQTNDSSKTRKHPKTEWDQSDPISEETEVKTSRKTEVADIIVVPKLRKHDSKRERPDPVNEGTIATTNRKCESSLIETVDSTKGQGRRSDTVKSKSQLKEDTDTVRSKRKGDAFGDSTDSLKPRKSEFQWAKRNSSNQDSGVKTSRKGDAAVNITNLPNVRKPQLKWNKPNPLIEDVDIRPSTSKERALEILNTLRSNTSEKGHDKSNLVLEEVNNAVRSKNRTKPELHESDKPHKSKKSKELETSDSPKSKSSKSLKRLLKSSHKILDDKQYTRQRLYDYINSLPTLTPKTSKSKEKPVKSKPAFHSSILHNEVQPSNSALIEYSRNPENPNFNKNIDNPAPFSTGEEPEEGELPQSPVIITGEKRPLKPLKGIDDLPDADVTFEPISSDIDASEFATNSNEGRLSPMSRRMASAPMNPFADMQPHHLDHTGQRHDTTVVKFSDLKTLKHTSLGNLQVSSKSSHKDFNLLELNPTRSFLDAKHHQLDYKSLNEHIQSSSANGNNCANCIHCREKLMKEEKRKAKKKEQGVQKIKLRRKQLCENSTTTAICIDIPVQDANITPPAIDTSPKKAWRSPAERKIMPAPLTQVARVKIEKKSVYEMEEELLDYDENLLEEEERSESVTESDLKVIPLIEIKEENDPAEQTVSCNILEEIEVFNNSMDKMLEKNKPDEDASIKNVENENIPNVANKCGTQEKLIVAEEITTRSTIPNCDETVTTSSCSNDVTTDTGQNAIITINDDSLSNQTQIPDLRTIANDNIPSENINTIEKKSPRVNKVLILENISVLELEPISNTGNSKVVSEPQCTKIAINTDIIKEVHNDRDDDSSLKHLKISEKRDEVQSNVLETEASIVESRLNLHNENSLSSSTSDAVVRNEMTKCITQEGTKLEVLINEEVSRTSDKTDSIISVENMSKPESRGIKSSASNHRHSSAMPPRKLSTATYSDKSKTISKSSTRQSSSHNQEGKNEKSSKSSDKDKNQHTDKSNRSRSRSSDPSKNNKDHGTSLEPDKKHTHTSKSSHKSSKDSKSESHRVDSSKDRATSKKDDGKNSQTKGKSSRSTSYSTSSHSKSDASKRDISKSSIVIQTDEAKRTSVHVQTDFKKNNSVSKSVQVGNVKTINKSVETDPKPAMISVRIQTDDIEIESTTFSTLHKGKSKKNVLGQMRDIDKEIERLLKLKSDLYRRADIYSDESENDINKDRKESKSEMTEVNTSKKSRKRGPKRKGEPIKDEMRHKTRRLRSHDNVNNDDEDNNRLKDMLESTLREIVDPPIRTRGHKAKLLGDGGKEMVDSKSIQHILEDTVQHEVFNPVRVENIPIFSSPSILLEIVASPTKSNLEITAQNAHEVVPISNQKDGSYRHQEINTRSRKLKSLADTLTEIDESIIHKDVTEGKVEKTPSLISKDSDDVGKVVRKIRTRKLQTQECTHEEIGSSTIAAHILEGNHATIDEQATENTDSSIKDVSDAKDHSSNDSIEETASPNRTVLESEKSIIVVPTINVTYGSVEETINTNPNKQSHGNSQDNFSALVDGAYTTRKSVEIEQWNTTGALVVEARAGSVKEAANKQIRVDNAQEDCQKAGYDNNSTKYILENEEQTSLTTPTKPVVTSSEEHLQTINKKSISERDIQKDMAVDSALTPDKDIWQSTVQEISLAINERNENKKTDESSTFENYNDIDKDNTSEEILDNREAQETPPYVCTGKKVQETIPNAHTIDEVQETGPSVQVNPAIGVPNIIGDDATNFVPVFLQCDESKLKGSKTGIKLRKLPKKAEHLDNEDVITQTRMARRIAHKNAEAVKIVEQTRRLRAQRKTAQKHKYIQSVSKARTAIAITDPNVLSIATNSDSNEKAKLNSEPNIPNVKDLGPRTSNDLEGVKNIHTDANNVVETGLHDKQLQLDRIAATNINNQSLSCTTYGIAIDIVNEDVHHNSNVHIQDATTSLDVPGASDNQKNKTDLQGIPSESEICKRKILQPVRRKRRQISNSSTSTTETLNAADIRRSSRGRNRRRTGEGTISGIISDSTTTEISNNLMEQSCNIATSSEPIRQIDTEISTNINAIDAGQPIHSDTLENAEQHPRSASISSLCLSDGLENLMEVAYEEPILNSEDSISGHRGPKRKRRRRRKFRSESMERRMSISLSETIDSVVRNLDTNAPHVDWQQRTKEYTTPTTPTVAVQFKPAIVHLVRYSLSELLTMKASLQKPITEDPGTTETETVEMTETQTESLTSDLDIKCEPRSVDSHRSDQDPVIDEEQPPSIDDSRLTVPYSQEDMHTANEMPNLQESIDTGNEGKDRKLGLVGLSFDVDMLEEITTDIINDCETQMGVFVADPITVDLPRDGPNDEPSTIIDRETFGGFVGPIIAVRAIESYVLGSSDRGILYIYDLATSELLFAVEIATKALTALCIVRPPGRPPSENKTDTTGHLLYTGALDRTVAVVDYKNGVVKQRIPCNEPVQCMEYKWGYVFVGTYNGSLRRLNTKTNEIEDSVNIAKSTVLQLKASQEGARRVLLVATRHQAVSVRDAMTGLLLRTMDTTLNPTVYTLLCDRSSVYCGTSKHDVLIYGFQDGQLIHKLEESNGSGVVCLTKYKKLLFTGCYNGNIYAYKLPSNQYVGVIPGPGGLLLSMDILDDKIAVSTRLNFKSIDIPDSILAHGS